MKTYLQILLSDLAEILDCDDVSIDDMKILMDDRDAWAKIVKDLCN